MTASSFAQTAFAKGMAFLALRDHLKEAEAAFREGLEADPDHPGCLLHLAVTLRNLGRLNEADKTLRRVLHLTPQDPVVHMQVGTLRRWQQRWPEALAAYDAALELDPAHVNTRVAKAMTLQEMSRWHEALESYNTLLADLPQEVGEACALEKRRNEVLEAIRRIESHGVEASLSPQDLASALYRRANQLVMEHAIDDAVRLYEEVARLRPDYSAPGFPLGETVETQLGRRPSGEYGSCHWIEGCLYLHPTSLGFCCTSHPEGRYSPAIGPYHGGAVPIDYVLARRHQQILINQDCPDSVCRTCHEFRHQRWEARPWALETLIISNHTVCTQKCSYCTLAQLDFEMPAYYYLAEPPLTSLLDHGWITPDTFIIWGGGEPTASKEFHTLATRLYETGCHLNIYTNATHVAPVLLEALRAGTCDTVTSVDAGTPATFYRMKYMSQEAVTLKHQDAFEAVWSHIATYAGAAPDRVMVKYVFTEGNIQEEDLRGFVDRCVTCGVTRILLAIEVSDMLHQTVPEEVWRAVGRTRDLAHARGLHVYFNPPFFRTGGAPEALMRTAQPLPFKPTPAHQRYLDIVGIAVSPPSQGA